MTPDLETARLLLRPLQLEDAELVQRLFPQWEIVKYLNARVPWPYPSDGVRSFYLDVCLPAIERGDEWDWTLRLKSSPHEIIGAISLVRGDKTNRGFWLAPEWQNRGLMTEAVIAANDFWFDTLGFTRLRVPKAVGNTASRRISEKTGMSLVGVEEEHEFVCGQLSAEIWEITADEWRAFRAKKRRLS
ncbi:MAG TPA: GNAT family N-acetyltransferase [Acidobacteriaceae bacterium]|nr:GNAT family N-acetyltransferase [Acidobacteriaceae bacterium]